MAFALGQGYKLYWGLTASTPTTPATETMTVYTAIGDIPDAMSITRNRNTVERRTRDDANARYVHMGDRTESVSFTLDLDLTDSAGYQDLQTAYNSDTPGVASATGTLGYFNITDATSGNLQWYGTAGVSDLSTNVTRADGVVNVSVTLEPNGDLTEAAHA